jgi:type II secretory pathway component PulK
MLVMVLAFLALMALIVVGSMLNQAAQRQDCLKLGGFLTDTGQCVKVTP